MISRFHVLNRFASVAFFITFILFSGACAVTEIPISEDVSGDTNTQADVENDTASLDVTTDTPDTPESDTKCGVCCPDDVRCSSNGTREVCNASGTAFVENACPETQQCDGGTCVDRPACTPGETRCHDTSTLLVCRANGMGFSTEECGIDKACIDARCVSGHSNGTRCAADIDCAGGKCRCGANDNCPGPWNPTYCTNECVKSNDCSSNEWCLSASLSPAPHNINHCVTQCDQSCAIDGLKCAHIPVHKEDGSLEWQQGCVQKELKSVGDKCSSDTECISGSCLEYFRDIKFCSNRCENSGCPSNSACVELENNQFWCSLTCTGSTGAKVCPLNQPTSQWGVGCKTLIIHGGNTATSTCAKTN